MTKEILGHIDCPFCGTSKGMRITPDKNGEPFGYCEAECSGQLRVGGDKRRVQAFLARFPWAKEQKKPVTETVSDTASPAAAPPKPPAKKPSSNPFDFLLKQGGQA